MASARDPMLREFQLFAENPASEVIDDVCALFTEDAVFEDTTGTAVAAGQRELRAFASEWFVAMPDLRVEPIEIFEAGLTAVMYLRLSGTHTGGPWMGVEPQGNRVSYRAVAIYRCNPECTQVCYETLAFDSALVIAQLRGEQEPEPIDAVAPAVVTGAYDPGER